MFSKSRLRPEVTPKRVYVLLKLINYKNALLTEEEVYKFIQLNNYNNFIEGKLVFNFCKVNNLIDVDFDNKVILKIDKEILKDEKTFRRFMEKLLYIDMDNNNMYLITERILSSSFDIYEITGFEKILLSLKMDKITKENILCWRFWAEYLGYGFILNSQFVINPYLRLKDFILENFKDKNINIMFGDFLNKLLIQCPEFKGTINEKNVFSHLSIALITLEKLNIIKLIETKDSSEKWSLNLEGTSRDVSNIEILGGR